MAGGGQQDESIALTFLNEFYQFVPPIIVGDADTTTNKVENLQKRNIFFQNLKEYRQGYGNFVEIMGIFYSNSLITTGLLKYGAEEVHSTEVYCINATYSL